MSKNKNNKVPAPYFLRKRDDICSLVLLYMALCDWGEAIASCEDDKPEGVIEE